MKRDTQMTIWRTYQSYIVSIALVLALFCVSSYQLFTYQARPVSVVSDNAKIDQAKTSTSFRYTAQFNKTLSNPRFEAFQELYRVSDSIAIPGLDSTDVLGRNCKDMVPQGICFTDKYVLISAYDHGNSARVGKYNSVIYVLSNRKGKQTYLTTIVLPDVNHVGGLTFDGKYVWIAKSTTKKCSAIDKRVLDQAVASGQNSFALAEYTKTVSCEMNASFITYYDGMLWVGSFVSRKNGVGTLQSYEIHGRGDTLKLVKSESLAIPSYANGAQFVSFAGKTCLAVMTSYSRYMNSEAMIYEVYRGHDGSLMKRKLSKIELPPLGEEFASDGKNIYAIFESGATEYSAPKYERCNYVVDRVCAFSIADFFASAKEGEAFQKLSASQLDVYERLICDALCPEEDDFTKYIQMCKLKSSLPKKAALLQICRYPDFYFASYYKWIRPWIPPARTG